jgi:hypothetical protein
MSFLILIQFMCCITLTDLSMMDHLCIPGMKSNCSCDIIIFNVFGILLGSILLRIFCI